MTALTRSITESATNLRFLTPTAYFQIPIRHGLTAGEMALVQEDPEGRVNRTTIRAGEYAINPPGVWHIADVADTATAVFITAGLGTETRPR